MTKIGRRWDQRAVYILHSEISTDPGLLKIQHSHRFVVVVVRILISIVLLTCEPAIVVSQLSLQ